MRHRCASSLSIKGKDFSRKLLEWWAVNKRDFPWRNTINPYYILLAELLLRKTTGKQVGRIFSLLVQKYPSTKSLAEADENELKQLLKPLGMEHLRTVLLKKLAQEINTNYAGKVPVTEEGLLTLPGVGKYAANSVLCMAYGYDVPMVDTNAIRLIQRVFSFKSQKKRPRDDPKTWLFVSALVPVGTARSFNLAIIDFAHAVCLPKKLHCSECPLKDNCDYGNV